MLFFPDAILFLAPVLFARIDWDRQFAFLTKELQQLQPEGPGGHGVADGLVKVPEISGGESFVLIHTEVQADPDHQIAERMFRYRYRAYDLFGFPIESLLILADTRPGFRPDPERLYWKTWLVRQPPELKQTFRADLGRIEEERQMKYVTSIEDMGREEGLQQGLQQGRKEGLQQGLREALASVLRTRFGDIPETVRAQMEGAEVFGT